MSKITDLLEEIEKIDMQINYVYRSAQNSVGPGSTFLFQELENLYEKKRQTQKQLEEICKSGNNS